MTETTGKNTPDNLAVAQQREMILFKRAKAANKRFMKGTGTFEAYELARLRYLGAKKAVEVIERRPEHRPELLANCRHEGERFIVGEATHCSVCRQEIGRLEVIR